MMIMVYSCILTVILVSYLCFVQGQSQCTTPTNRRGICIPIKNCSRLLALVTNPQRSNEQTKLLKDSQCGTDKLKSPMVCCETEPPGDQQCFTYEGNEGTCINIKQCPYLENMLKPPVLSHNRNYVNSHRHNRDVNLSVSLDGTFRVRGREQYISFLCGGVLISSRYVLTAAHCFNHPPKLPKIVRVGEHDTSVDGPDCVEVGGKLECTDGAISVPIEAVHIHHSYNSTKRVNDIALLRLQYDVPYTDFIRPICLPTSDLEKGEHTLYTIGFGAVAEKKRTSNKKLHVDVPFVPTEECRKVYLESYRFSYSEGHICAGGIKGRGTCNGDSGGPLMSYDGFYELIGITNLGKGCGAKNVPDIFSKVYYYLPWIRSLIKP